MVCCSIAAAGQEGELCFALSNPGARNLLVFIIVIPLVVLSTLNVFRMLRRQMPLHPSSAEQAMAVNTFLLHFLAFQMVIQEVVREESTRIWAQFAFLTGAVIWPMSNI